MGKNYNLINSGEIAPYLAKFTNHNKDVERLLVVALGNALKKHAPAIRKVERLPPDAPDWLVKKWDDGKVWHEFFPRNDIRLPGRVAIVSRWLRDCLANKEDWLSKTDPKGRPTKLLKIGSLQQAYNMVEKYEQQVQSSNAPALRADISGKDVETVEQLTDDICVVQLLSEKALDREGRYLGHCVGCGKYDKGLHEKKYSFYSFRDKKNRPLMTLQVDYLSKRFIQCRTAGNKRAHGALLDHLNTFAQQMRISPSTTICDQYLYKDNMFLSEYYSLDDMEEISGSLFYSYPNRRISLAKTLHIAGTLGICGYPFKTISLPRKLYIAKNFVLSSNAFLKSIPKVMEVKGDFEIYYCDKIEKFTIPRLHSGKFSVSHCRGLRFVNGEALDMQTIFFEGCPLLERVPERMSADYVSFVGCDALQALPESLHSKNGLRLMHCGNVRELPDDMVIKGPITTEYGVFQTVDAFRKAFEAQKAGGERYWFMPLKKSSLFLVCLSLPRRNSTASTVPIGLRMRRSTHIFCSVSLSTRSSSFRVPDF